jgi:hypothetical protein
MTRFGIEGKECLVLTAKDNSTAGAQYSTCIRRGVAILPLNLPGRGINGANRTLRNLGGKILKNPPRNSSPGL